MDEQSSERRRGGRRPTVLLAVNTILLLVALGGLAWAVTQPLGPSGDDGQTFSGEALLQEEAARRGLAEGRRAPGFAATPDGEPLELTSLSGDPVPLTDFFGRPVWIVFWATTCHACQLEEADMRRAYAAHRADGLVLLAIDIGEDAEVVRRYAQERRLPWTVLLDPASAAVDAYGAIGTPSHYFITADGVIQSRAFGRLDYAEMSGYIAPLMNR